MDKSKGRPIWWIISFIWDYSLWLNITNVLEIMNWYFKKNCQNNLVQVIQYWKKIGLTYVVTLTLGLQPRQGFAKVRAKNEA